METIQFNETHALKAIHYSESPSFHKSLLFSVKATPFSGTHYLKWKPLYGAKQMCQRIKNFSFIPEKVTNGPIFLFL